MLDPRIKFVAADLANPLKEPLGRFDLAISVEVAEHLPKEAAETFIDNLVSLSDEVVFGAAYEHQGGVNHLNEQKHIY